MGETTRAKPGSRLIPTGVVILVLSIALLVMNLTSDVHRYVPGSGYVQIGGTPSVGFWVLLLGGLLVTGAGIVRRALGSK